MTKNVLAIFEQQTAVLDHFIGEAPAWEEVTRAWVRFDIRESRERTETNEQTNLRRSLVRATWTPELAAVTTKHRVRVRKTIGVDDANPAATTNYRVFGIDAIVNVDERNRELQMQLVERN